MLEKADFAVFVCIPDDETTNRKGKRRATVRDNVIFELGLFIGKLGRERTFLIGPRDTQIDLPSDLKGIDPETYNSTIDHLATAVGPACTRIRNEIQRLGPIQRPTPDTQKPDLISNENLGKPMLPEVNWTIRNYQSAIVIAILNNDLNSEGKIDQAFRKSPLASSQEELTAWDAYVELTKIQFGKSGQMQVIRDGAKAFPNNERLTTTLADALAEFDEYDEAAKTYVRSAQIASNLEIRARAIRELVGIQAMMSDPTPTETLRTILLGGTHPDDASNPQIVEAMIAIATSAQLSKLSAAIAEYRISLAPDDANARFDAAWRYSEGGQDALSMFHYKSVALDARTGTIWNNLGVSYARLNIQGLSVEAYEKAAKAGEAIAEGNLAHHEIESGFFGRAEERLSRILTAGLAHETISTARTALAEARSAEATAVEKEMTKVRALRSMLIKVGKAAIVLEGAEIAGCWETQYGQIEIRSDGNGNYPGEAQWIRKTMRSLHMLFAEPTNFETLAATLQLTRFGNAFEGTLKIDNAGKSTSLLGSLPDEKELILFLNSDGASLEGFELQFGETPILWKRVVSQN